MPKMEKVFTLGPAGTYCHEAAVKFFGPRVASIKLFSKTSLGAGEN